jgi:2-polyprenyl-3-methyl-5-hydroxy-6-metoxy-1,4-benzoquinol methylase
LSDPGLYVDLGLPVPRGRKLRSIQRGIAKVLWPLLRIQVLFNRSSVEQLRATQTRVDELEARMNRAVSDLEHHSAVLTRHESFATSNRALETRIDLAQQQAFARVTEAAGLLQRQLSDLAMELQAITSASIEAHDRDVQTRAKEAQTYWQSELSQLSRALDSQLGLLSRGISELRQRFGSLDLMLDGLRAGLPSPSPTSIVPDPRMDSLYVSLENAFRGSSELIKERLAIYLSDLRDPIDGKPVLDVGCGRGELLELLQSEGVPAYGIEINSTYADAWAAAGLDVRVVDVTAHLRELPEHSLSAITAIHVVEHIGTEQLLEFLDLALRALDSGGLLILETPNPANLIVGADTFYMDPSHRNPIPAELLAFLVRSRGFGNAEIRYLQRSTESPFAKPDASSEWAADIEPVQDILRQRLFGPEDYAVVACRI